MDHRREITIETTDLGHGRILLVGTLRDRRFKPREGEEWTGPRVVHEMVARLIVQGPEMTILEAEAEMSRCPMDECREATAWMDRLVGQRIISGFTQRVKDLMGDTKGCAHLTSLIISMGPEAVQGYWAAYGTERSKLSLDDPRVQRVINTCHLWREDGPIVRRLRG
jgi:hypothetical protein